MNQDYILKVIGETKNEVGWQIIVAKKPPPEIPEELHKTKYF